MAPSTRSTPAGPSKREEKEAEPKKKASPKPSSTGSGASAPTDTCSAGSASASPSSPASPAPPLTSQVPSTLPPLGSPRSASQPIPPFHTIQPTQVMPTLPLDPRLSPYYHVLPYLHSQADLSTRPLPCQSLPTQPSQFSSGTEGTDAAMREVRSLLFAYMDRTREQDAQISALLMRCTTQDERISHLTRETSSLTEQLSRSRARELDQEIRVRTLSEELSALRVELQEARTEFQEDLATRAHAATADPALEDRLATIQTEVQRTSSWVQAVRAAPAAQRTTVSETLTETRRRADRALNIRIRGIEKTSSQTPMDQATAFVTGTLGVQEHGVVSAYRAGKDPSRSQPLIIRFRDAQARLAALRRRGTLRAHPEIHMDEDLTPIQWEEHRALLAQRDAARREGKWAVIRDGRLLTGVLRQRPPASPGHQDQGHA